MKSEWAWMRRRRRAGWVLVMAMPFLLAAQMPAAAGRIASQLSGEREMESVRGDLVRELAVERLCRLGLERERATAVLEAVLASGADRMLAEAVTMGSRDGRRTGAIRADRIRDAADRLSETLTASSVGESDWEQALVRALGPRVGDGDLEGLLQRLGCGTEEAAILARDAEATNWIWVDAGQTEWAADVGAKVVGVNVKGIFVLIVPILIVLAVALAAGADAAPFLAGAAAMGLVFVLFTDPAFLFGAGDGGD